MEASKIKQKKDIEEDKEYNENIFDLGKFLGF